ncbi:uncharacterized protein LOC116307309 [Actinia tenebrosa]|uniref:Uncharacterized protein LOC116307309 n=1 Tax=Actinia tenebrosa TaxID=6105 RepID=A0A6P8J1D8_ACTTE|nr:uncharacterized protein LOC116307309 [Actinia tenebrosa]
MVPIAETTIFDEDLEKFVLGSASDFSDSDEEDSEDDSCALNVSCHSSHFKGMVKDNDCGSLTVKKRKLQTHLDHLDIELSTLCCSYEADDCHERSKTKNNVAVECDVAPVSAESSLTTKSTISGLTNQRKRSHQTS